MAIYPALFGHVELPDPTPWRHDRTGTKPVGVRLVRPIDLLSGSGGRDSTAEAAVTTLPDPLAR